MTPLSHSLSHLILLAFLTACATVSNPVPEAYKGPVVQLLDTGKRESGNKGQFFAAVEIDGRAIENALTETRTASYARGYLALRFTTRDVPATAMKIKIIGTHQTAAPIQEIASRMAGTFFSVEGVVDFNPAPGHPYAVTGELEKERSCVWIVDADSNHAATEKVCTH